MDLKRINIGDREVGDGQPAFIIAEVSANHRGKLEVAMNAIENAAKAGADAVKFQHLTAEKIASDISVSFEWKGQKDFKTLSEFYKKSELPYAWTSKLVAHAKKNNIMFLSTPFDHEAVDVLDAAGVPAFKNASYEMTDDILLRYMAAKKKPVILSTGMAYMEEVRHAVHVLHTAGCKDVIALHCVSMYPPNPADINLRAMEAMRKELGILVGYSDHSAPQSNTAVLVAVAMGACVIERHITDSQKGGSRDDENSMTAEQFKDMVAEIRELESSMGSGIKAPVSRPDAELDEVRERGTRRSLYAARDILVGETLKEDMLITLRPMRGIEPKDMNSILGKKMARAIKARQPITTQDIS